MLGRSWVLALLLVLFIPMVTSSGNAIPGLGNEDSSPLVLTVRADQHTYHLSDKISLETQFTNVSNDAWYLYEWDLCWNFAAGLVIHAVDAKGKVIQTDFLIDCVPPPPKSGEPYQFIKIDAGRFYGLADKFPARELVKAEGEYDIEVTFGSHISKSWLSEFFANEPISKLPLWTMEKPILRANRVHIKVVK